METRKMGTDNSAMLREKFERVWESLNKAAENADPNVKIENTRNNMLTLCVENSGNKLYIHSKYNPLNEAEMFVNQFKDVDKYDHVIFYGIGMAYHIEAFFSKFGNKHFSIYEPFLNIFKSYISYRSMDSIPLDYLDNIFIGDSLEDPYECIEALLKEIEGEVLLVILPSYERIFSQEYKNFYQRFGSILEDTKALNKANRLFEKLYVTNIMKNFREIINSPNILHLKNNEFKCNPAILVAAGPSLEYELENLRYIKEKGLAYIFSVGSAINTLLEYDIYPDAALTYDPQNHNPIVFKKLKERGSTSIPIVFGTIAGYGTVQAYEGPKLHFISSNDYVAPYFFKPENAKEFDTVLAAGSIAVAALQILYKLGCDPIILAGQNLAYKDMRLYAKGIDYGRDLSETDNKYLDSSFMVDDVEGNKIHTNKVLNHYKDEFERYIKHYNIKNIINTTRGGAAIYGTVYKPLQSVIENILVSSIVDVNWYKDESVSYDIDYMISRCKSIEAEHKKLIDIFESIKKFAAQINENISSVDAPESLFSYFYAEFNKMTQNTYFNTFLYPMNYYQCSLLNRKISSINSEKDIVLKIQKLCREIEPFIDGCINDMRLISPLFEDMYEAIMDNDIKIMTFIIKS
jgi:hypothetical protein